VALEDWSFPRSIYIISAAPVQLSKETRACLQILPIPSIPALFSVLGSVSRLRCAGSVSAGVGGALASAKNKPNCCSSSFGWAQKRLYNKPFPTG